MNYLRYKKLYQSDNDGTFWPGYVELPDEDDSSQINKDQEEGDQHGHPARHHLGLYQEADPAHYHKHGTG